MIKLLKENKKDIAYFSTIVAIPEVNPNIMCSPVFCSQEAQLIPTTKYFQIDVKHAFQLLLLIHLIKNNKL